VSMLKMIRVWQCTVLLLPFSFLSSCTMASKSPSTPVTGEGRRQLSLAQSEIDKKDFKRALRRLQLLSEKDPGSEAAAEANYLSAELFCNQTDYTNCYRNYLKVIDSKYVSAKEPWSALGAAKALHKLGRYDEALSMAQRALRYPQTSKAFLSQTHEVRFLSSQALGQKNEALRALVALSQTSDNQTTQSKAKTKALEILDSVTNTSEIQSIATDGTMGLLRGPAYFRLAQLALANKDFSGAEGAFGRVIEIEPASDLAAQSRTILEQIAGRRRVDPYVIGAVLPLTGKYSSIGYKTLHGLQMGLGLSGGDSSSFKLAVVDSAGNSDVARRAVDKLVSEDSVIAIVGDLTSKTAEAVALKGDELGVPTVALSQRTGLTSIGPYVFRNALTSRAIVAELVRSAMEDQGLKKFAVLFPNDSYGVEYTNLFWDEVTARGGEIRSAQPYDPKTLELRGPIQRLVGTFFVESRLEEYNFFLKGWFGSQKFVGLRTAPPDDLLKPVVDFEALFIPDSVTNLGQVASMLLYNDVSGVRLMGTNLWNSPELIERGTQLIENALFVDSVTSTPDVLRKTDFFKKYLAHFSSEPSIFEAQAYDSALALRNLVSGGARSRVELRDRLSQLDGLRGSSGALSVSESREFSRPLSSFTVKQGKIEIASPATANTKL
jgi:branched-chain amino acid transport system substrate-binding protein